jgi:hypothetical protein
VQLSSQQSSSSGCRALLTSLHVLTGSLLHCSTSLVTSLHSTLLLVLGTSSQVTSAQLCMQQQQQQGRVTSVQELGVREQLMAGTAAGVDAF